MASYRRAVSTEGLVPWGLLEPAPFPGHRTTAFHRVSDFHKHTVTQMQQLERKLTLELLIF